MTAPAPLTTHTLSNGLTVFLREKHDAPLISFWVWYRVGSRNEIPGKTGLSHWVEHMQFKGTPSLEKGAIFREVSSVGGALNAMTSNDWTAYYETLPREQIELALRIESDRMCNSLFDPEETERERTVILSERQGAENRPTYLLAEEVNALAFTAHPYGHMVLGYEHDLKSISRDDLYAHYQHHYHPGNAFITVAGDFESPAMLDQIEQWFGPVPSVDTRAFTVASEPPQRGERRITLHHPSPAPYLLMGYRMPDARHPDIPAILVADAILSGAKTMGMGGGGGMGKSSRLYKALVTRGLARSAGSTAGLQLDPELWGFSATALEGVEPAVIEQAIEGEIEKLAGEPASAAEFAKAMKQTRAQYAYSNETATSQAYWLGKMEIVDHAQRVDTLAEELASVTPEDVQRVASTWLRRDQSTVGWQLPSTKQTSISIPAADHDHRIAMFTGSEVSAHGFVRTTLRGNIPLLAQPRAGTEVVAATISIEAGQAATGETHAGLAAITSRMLKRGTERYTHEVLNEQLDALGAVISTEASARRIGISLQCLREDLQQVLTLVTEILTSPTFPESELTQVQQQAIVGIRERENDTRSVAGRTLHELIYPENHPLHIRTGGTEESIASITQDQLKHYHRRFIAPNVATIAVAGEIGSVDAIRELLESALQPWQNSAPNPVAPVPAPMPEISRTEHRTIAGKSQADIALGVPTLHRMHPDYHALNLANLILGRLGLMGRLGANVRDRQGLAYYAHSSLAAGRASGLWHASAGVDPANVNQAIAAIQFEVAQLLDQGVTAPEFTDARNRTIGSAPLALESLSGVIGMLLLIEEFDLGLDYVEKLPGILMRLTREDIQEAARTHLHPELLQIGIAGPEVERM